MFDIIEHCLTVIAENAIVLPSSEWLESNFSPVNPFLYCLES